MSRSSEELAHARREEIINACARLYEKKSFKEITLKEIGEATSFTRTSIYNYFQTKEEIFLALLQREYRLWDDRLRQIRSTRSSMTRSEFADTIAHSLEERKNLLKLLSMNHYDLEENSRTERLVEFKLTYKETLEEIRNCLEQYFPDMTEAAIQEFIFSFFPFMFGIYPYTFVTEKQRTAMEAAEVDYVYLTVYDITFAHVKKLLGVF